MIKLDNAELETRIRGFLERINETNADAMCGMIKGSFVSVNAEIPELIVEYPVQYWERNAIGRMQGGVMGTLLDFTSGCLSCAITGGKPVTVTLNISYLRAGPLEGTRMVRTRATKLGRTLNYFAAECWEKSEPGKLIATASCVFMAQMA